MDDENKAVQFDEGRSDSFTSRKIFGDPTVPAMSRLFIKAGLAKNGRQAEYWMIGVVCACLLLTAYICISLFAPQWLHPIRSGPDAATSEQLQEELQNAPPLVQNQTP